MDKILVVENSSKLKKYLVDLLEKRGFEVKTTSEGADVILLIEKYIPNIILLDINIKDIDGESLCWEIRKDFPEIPIIMLYEKPLYKQIMRYYRSGADDFVIKPINTIDLISRIQMQLKDQRFLDSTIKVADLNMDTRNYEVKRNGKKIELSPQEFKLLKFLMNNANRVLSRDIILSRVWRYDQDIQSRAVDVYIGYLRDKIDKNRPKKLIRTIRGFGYMIKE